MKKIVQEYQVPSNTTILLAKIKERKKRALEAKKAEQRQKEEQGNQSMMEPLKAIHAEN